MALIVSVDPSHNVARTVSLVQMDIFCSQRTKIVATRVTIRQSGRQSPVLSVLYLKIYTQMFVQPDFRPGLQNLSKFLEPLRLRGRKRKGKHKKRRRCKNGRGKGQKGCPQKMSWIKQEHVSEAERKTCASRKITEAGAERWAGVTQIGCMDCIAERLFCLSRSAPMLCSAPIDKMQWRH